MQPSATLTDEASAASSPAPAACTRRPPPGETLGVGCLDCGHAYLLHAFDGGPCVVCELHEAARAIVGIR